MPPYHPHPDVWLLVLVLAGGYVLALRAFRPPGAEPAGRGRVASYIAGVATVWVAGDWPVHDLSEGYLYSVHMVQHMLLSLIAPPLLLYGLPPWVLRRLVSPAPLGWAVRNLARPFVALVLFNVVIVLTHWPSVVDMAVASEPAHFVTHAVLFGAALLMWWPVLSPLIEMPTMSYPARMMYLFLQSIVPTVPASFLTFGSEPLYRVYETFPRIWGMSALTDMRIAGLTMKIVGGAILWAVIAVIFFKWHRQEQTEGWDALEWRRMERDVRIGGMAR